MTHKKFLTFLLLFSFSFFLTTNVNAVTTISLNIDTGGTLTVTGNASLGTVNGNTITTGTGILTIGAGKTLTISNTLTFAGTNGSTLNIGTGGTLGTAAYTASTAYASTLGADDNYVTDAEKIVIGNTSGTNSGNNAVNTLYSGLVTNATHTGDATGSGALTVVALNGTNLAVLGTGILKNTTGTGVPSIAVAGDFPTLNQNTTGSAATLTTARAIYGNDFNGSAALTGIIASTYGGTGNGFTKFSGPTTSEKTFTLPDASATIATIDATQTFTNKRTNPRIISAASYTTDTGTSLDVSTADQFVVTAQAGALLFNAPSGTPVEGQKLIIRIKDNGTAKALTYNLVFRAIGVALPTTTVLSKTLYMGFIYNSTDTKWDLVAVAQEA